ncbi:MarR family winged helix-turn-helix transcriptional regulator [Garciella nitratireducens]|uniref:MarR family winged helix-turn-helix transcriptional regulator n=1 Tax=Garciella nitratireducens TaxID=218205 RepID=UPI001BD57F85|nr:MarR family transcriptional regulator [Garciella nitratireducens]
MDSNITEIYSLIQDLSWYFGNQGFDGECYEDLSLVEYMALKKVCGTKNITIQDIGVALNITKSGVSKVIDRLEEKNYVLRERSSEDGRVCCVQPTKRGLNAVKKISDQYSKYLMEALDSVQQDLLSNIKDVLELLYSSIREKGYIK